MTRWGGAARVEGVGPGREVGNKVATAEHRDGFTSLRVPRLPCPAGFAEAAGFHRRFGPTRARDENRDAREKNDKRLVRPDVRPVLAKYIDSI
jgi:hypothetical protein